MRTTQLDQLLPKDVVERLLAFRRDVERALPGAVEDMILFGSRARGDAQANSDYDVAVLLKDGLADHSAVRDRVSDVVWDHLSDDIPIQAVPLNADAFRPARTDLAMRIVADGIPVR